MLSQGWERRISVWSDHSSWAAPQSLKAIKVFYCYDHWRSQSKISGGGGGQNFIGFSSGAPRIRQRGCPNRGYGGEAPSSHGFLRFCKKNTHFSIAFLSKNGLNPPLLALLVDLRYSISVFVCRLAVTENISGGGGGQLSLSPPSPLLWFKVKAGKQTLK